jgi:hypothetical protein
MFFGQITDKTFDFIALNRIEHQVYFSILRSTRPSTPFLIQPIAQPGNADAVS